MLTGYIPSVCEPGVEKVGRHVNLLQPVELLGKLMFLILNSKI